MVRRLVQHFLNWLRQILAQLRGENNRRPTTPPSQQLPPARPQPTSASLQQQPPISPPLPDQPPSPVPGLSTYQEAPPPSKETPTPSSRPPNPASQKSTTTSNFKVLLSDYQYSPSPAVQSLSDQLAHSDNQQSPALPSLKPTLESDTSFPPQNNPKKDYQTASESSEEPEKKGLQSDASRDLGRTGIDNLMLREREDNNATVNLAPPQPAIESDNQATTEQTPAPMSHHLNTTSQTLDSRQGIITKKGVVKLLFKLKKNNHHGYIAPDDGSKDIIFHQKYIGNDVFCQLERGMAVEVTAHVTEGKAYADCVRIL